MPAVRLLARPGGAARSIAVARPAHPPLALALADQGRFLVRRFFGTLACTGLVTQSAKKSPEEQLGRRTRTERCQVRSSGLSNLQYLTRSVYLARGRAPGKSSSVRAVQDCGATNAPAP